MGWAILQTEKCLYCQSMVPCHKMEGEKPVANVKRDKIQGRNLRIFFLPAMLFLFPI